MLHARFLKLSDRYDLISKNLLIIPYDNINDNDVTELGIVNKFNRFVYKSKGIF